ncbi:MAG: DUF4231 domain-containing protein [Pseudomonadota bacterium]|nr:DUF4231 domain-containing protein [Pseudomonadota bacterium]
MAKLPLSEKQHAWISHRFNEDVLKAAISSTSLRSKFTWLRYAGLGSAFVVPSLAAFNAAQTSPATWVRWTTLVVSIIAALSTGFDQVFRFGARWRLYRRSYVRLLAVGWDFVELQGDFSDPDHTTAFPSFFRKCEDLIVEREESYLTEVANPVLDGDQAGLQGAGSRPK